MTLSACGWQTVWLRIRSLAAGMLLVGAVLQTTLGQARWTEIQSPNFLAISNAGRAAGQDFVRQLEQFQGVVSELFQLERVTGVPLLVVIFRDDRSFTPYKFLVQGKPAPVGGFYQRSRDLDVIAVNADQRAIQPASIIFREYVHRLTSYSAQPWPRWLSEGMAEFYSSFELEKDQVALGVPLDHHVELLRESEMLSIDRLIQVEHDSPEYTHNDKKGIFYAQSWALVHFLMMAEKGRFRSELIKFTELIELAYDRQDAFYRSFDLDLAELQDRLQAYVAQDAYFVSKYVLSGAAADRKIETRRLGETDSRIYLGDLLRVVKREEDARRYYERAVALGDSSGRAHQGLGILEWRNENYQTAESELLEALKGSPNDALTAYYLTDIKIRRLEGRSGLDGAETTELFADLDRTIGLRPNFARNRLLFGQLALLSGEHIAEAVEHLQEAVRLEPHEAQFRVALVQLLMTVPDYDQAELEVEKLRRSENAGAAGYADSVMLNLEQLKASLESAGSNQDSVRQEAYPECNPSFVDVRGLAYFDGLLRRVQCGPEEVLFILSVDGQEFSFRDPQPQEPVVFSCGLDVVQMECGKLGVPARIYYQDLKEAGRRALAVELKPYPDYARDPDSSGLGTRKNAVAL